MEIKVTTKLIWREREFFLVATKPRFSEHRPNCNNYMAVPYDPEKGLSGKKVIEITVPKDHYLTVKMSEKVIEVE